MHVRVSGHEGTAKLGRTDFVVLAIEYSEPSGLSFRVDEDGKYGGTPFIVKASKCVVLEGTLPSSWRAKWRPEDGILDLAPPEWLADGFWQAYFDREPNAVAAYRRAKAVIEAESRVT